MLRDVSGCFVLHDLNIIFLGQIYEMFLLRFTSNILQRKEKCILI